LINPLALLFERYFDESTGTHSIEIWYKNNKEFTDLTAETCGESPCSLDQLEQAWLPVIPLVSPPHAWPRQSVYKKQAQRQVFWSEI
jgi:hypothetical protein